MRDKNIEQCIDELCGRGCREVRRIIALLEKGEPVPGTAGLSGSELTLVLKELRAVMSVYDARSACG